MPLLSIAGHFCIAMLESSSNTRSFAASSPNFDVVDGKRGALGQASTDSLTGLLEQFAENEIEISSGN